MLNNCNDNEPFLFHINNTVTSNQFFRNTIWSGNYMQFTVMCLMPGEDIGVEIHETIDQFLLLADGQGIVITGSDCHHMTSKKLICPGIGVIIPSCTFHNVINTGKIPMKLLSIYAPPAHIPNTIQEKKPDPIKL